MTLWEISEHTGGVSQYLFFSQSSIHNFELLSRIVFQIVPPLALQNKQEDIHRSDFRLN